nr:ead/Ea22-like family protein [Escherichia fergusonii]
MFNRRYQELRERYSPQPVPKCRICGDEMTVQRICGRHITYGCTGATYDDKGCYYAEGRSIADDHYGLSRVTVIDVSDPEVLALLDERERNQQYIKRRDQENEDIALTVGKLRVELEAAEKRIAELEAEPVSQTYKLNELSGNSPVTPDSWISCSERMPEDTKMLLAFSQGEIVAAYWNWVVNPIDYKKYRAFTYLSGNILDDVTHWMPLPEPPQHDGE